MKIAAKTWPSGLDLLRRCCTFRGRFPEFSCNFLFFLETNPPHQCKATSTIHFFFGDFLVATSRKKHLLPEQTDQNADLQTNHSLHPQDVNWHDGRRQQNQQLKKQVPVELHGLDHQKCAQEANACPTELLRGDLKKKTLGCLIGNHSNLPGDVIQ